MTKRFPYFLKHPLSDPLPSALIFTRLPPADNVATTVGEQGLATSVASHKCGAVLGLIEKSLLPFVFFVNLV